METNKLIFLGIFFFLGIVLLVIGINYKRWNGHKKTNPRKLIGKQIKAGLRQSGMQIYSIILGAISLLISCLLLYFVVIKPNLSERYSKKSTYIRLIGDSFSQSIPLKYVYSDVNPMEKIKRMDMANCFLDEVPPFIWEFQNLESINMTNNDFQNLPIELIKKRNLKYLSLVEIH